MKIWKAVALTSVCASLTACAGTYDQSAVPLAGQEKSLAYERCSAAPKTTVTNLTECLLAADLAFARAIKLKDMTLYNAYAERMRLATAEREAGKITPQELMARATTISGDYYKSIDQAAAIDAERRARMAAALSAMGQSMQREADRQAYIQAHQQQPLNCTSTGFGNTVTTHCN